MSILKQPINYKDLETELYKALRADELYKLQNDAKIRAVEQRVPTYENFKEMVNGAHLKPLEHADIKSKIGVPWNTLASDDSKTQDRFYATSILRSDRTIASKHKNADAIIPSKVPRTTEEFLQTWRNMVDHEAKFTYLLIIRSNLHTLFRAEIPLGIVAEIIDTCSRNLSNEEDIGNALDIATKLSRCNRFDLSVSFMTKEERAVSKEFFQRLLAAKETKELADEDIVSALRRKYRVTFD